MLLVVVVDEGARLGIRLELLVPGPVEALYLRLALRPRREDPRRAARRHGVEAAALRHRMQDFGV